MLARLSIVVGLSASCAGRTARPAAPIATRAGVVFVVSEPGAHSVALAGSFNQWSATSHRLVRDGSHGTWTIVVRLPPGEYQYVYVVDGTRWIAPPAAEDYADDGFGAKNGVLVVGR
jgi:1,4-alpha-glucan branching enzyme